MLFQDVTSAAAIVPPSAFSGKSRLFVEVTSLESVELWLSRLTEDELGPIASRRAGNQ